MESNTKDPEVQKIFNWKIVLVLFSTLTLIALIFLIKLRGYFSSYVNSELFDKYYNVFVGILFLNMCLSTYTITIYYYRVRKPGMKGQPGKYGDLGDPGDAVSCDLYTPKKRRFRLEKEVKVEKYEVDNEIARNATLDLDRRRIDPKWFNINSAREGGVHASENYESPAGNVLGNKFSTCIRKRGDEKCRIQNGNENAERGFVNQGIGVIEDVYNKRENKLTTRYSTKPFNGGIFNYDLNHLKTQGKINSMQFTYDKNQPMRKKKVKLALAGSKLGNENNDGTGSEFTCPPHSSVYKIETLHDVDKNDKTGKIVGMKFYCKDIRSGEHVKILNSENNFVDNVHFGVEPRPDNKKYKYGKVECGNYQRCKRGGDGQKKCKGRPGFLSNVTAIDDDDGIIAMRFNKCSYLEPNPIKDPTDVGLE